MKYKSKFGNIMVFSGQAIDDGYETSDGKIFKYEHGAVYLIGSKSSWGLTGHYNEWSKTNRVKLWYKDHEVYMGELM